MNRAYLLGNLTKDPEIKYTPGGNAVCRFGLATNRSIKKRDSEEWESIATFHNIVCWGKTAEWFAKTYSRGHKVLVQGRIDNRSYDDKDGNKRFISEVVAEEIFPMVSDNRKPSHDEALKEEVDTKASYQIDEKINIDELLNNITDADFEDLAEPKKGGKVPF